MFTETNFNDMQNKELIALARILINKKPAIAEELLNYLPIKKKAVLSDLSLISFYFYRFCSIQGLNPEENIGPVYKWSKIYQRRIFIGAIIILYNPRTRLLAKNLSETLQQHKVATCRMIPEVEQWYKVNDDFRQSVDQMISLLLS